MTSAAAWNEIEVRTWHEFSGVLERVLVEYTVPPLHLFRGQANAEWLLAPSLLRQIRITEDRKSALKIEELLEAEFKAQAVLFPETRSVLPVLRDDDHIEWWAYMQHHSCPTRLLDWTASAFVGAYFAVNQHPKTDGALFVVAADAIKRYNERQYPDKTTITDTMLIDPDTSDFVTFAGTRLRSNRMVAQQGYFSVSSNPFAPHDRPILEACSALGPEHPSHILQQKIVIVSSLKPEILQRLRTMNVAPHALFPTLDGLGRSLADLASLKANPNARLLT